MEILNEKYLKFALKYRKDITPLSPHLQKKVFELQLWIPIKPPYNWKQSTLVADCSSAGHHFYWCWAWTMVTFMAVVTLWWIAAPNYSEIMLKTENESKSWINVLNISVVQGQQWLYLAEGGREGEERGWSRGVCGGGGGQVAMV